MGRIRMDSIQITDKIHMDQLRSLDMVDIDMWGGVGMEKRPRDGKVPTAMPFQKKDGQLKKEHWWWKVRKV